MFHLSAPSTKPAKEPLFICQKQAFKLHVTLAYGDALPDELSEAILGGETHLHLDNVCLVTPEGIITALPLLTEGEEELLAVEQEDTMS